MNTFSSRVLLTYMKPFHARHNTNTWHLQTSTTVYFFIAFDKTRPINVSQTTFFSYFSALFAIFLTLPHNSRLHMSVLHIPKTSVFGGWGYIPFQVYKQAKEERKKCMLSGKVFSNDKCHGCFPAVCLNSLARTSFFFFF